MKLLGRTNMCFNTESEIRIYKIAMKSIILYASETKPESSRTAAYKTELSMTQYGIKKLGNNTEFKTWENTLNSK